MISIDFGNSYTKVSIRVNDNENSRPVKDGSLEFDEYNICIPTVAALLKDKLYYGVDVRKIGDVKGLRTYRNWKPLFFETNDETEHATVAASVSTLGRAMSGDTGSYSTEAEREGGYRDYLSNALSDPRFDVTSVQSYDKWRMNLDSSRDMREMYKEIALGFFKWLRIFVEPIGSQMGIANIGDHPVRIMLPNFGNQTAAREMLVAILREAGWNPAKHSPAIHEPLANIIGVSTGGKNRVWEPSPGVVSPTYFGMFEGASLFKAIRDFHTNQSKRQVFWMMAVDLGGYTTDFGMVGFDLADIEQPIQGELDGRQRVATISIPHGVQMLDNRVLEIVSSEKASHLATLLKDPDQHRLESLHRRIYQQGVEYTSGPRDNQIVFREGDEAAAIDDCISQFAHEIAEKAEAFLEAHQYSEVDCVVLTGGGFHIPIIRNVICERIERYSPREHRALAYVSATEEMSALPPYWRQIPADFVRGATAAGGASIWFDSAADAWSND